jgi:hypothetical protein
MSFHCQKLLELSFLSPHANLAADLHILHSEPLCDTSYWNLREKNRRVMTPIGRIFI